ncbi:hypothetical protein PDESU_01596 [Pontiella desulfatans]|uniref:LamG-like jellyroll fold domain-containing protein n=1 Tax=Pontiella desulfatans TaxID=2750659 RepID=A0A6C2TZF0_PONDE|nr:LamG-like jellyroll fold domain-containing protein [Pontiella desulfatans]VGO13042.1 hypothetical protein PDESU_01596 [Pontiella desulfatans]
MKTGWIQQLGLALVLTSGGASASDWQRNTFPGQGHVDHGFAPGAGWSHMESTMDISVSPLDPNFRAVLENEWGAVYTEDGINYKPLRMQHIGAPECSAQSVEFSRYDADTFYLRIAHEYWDSIDPVNSPAGLWRSTDRGETWQHLYQPPAGGYEHDSADNNGRTMILEDPCPARSNHLWFASTSEGLLRSTDNGASWSSVADGLFRRRMRMVTAVTNDANETILYAIAEKNMPRHTAGETIPLDAWAPGDVAAQWQFNENLEDASDNGYDLAGSVSGWTDSVIEGRHAALFDGTTFLDSINLTYAGTYSDLSVSAWVQTTNNADQVIVSYDPNEYFELGTRQGGSVTNVALEEFTTGYVPGELRNHSSWSGDAGFLVDTNSPGMVTLDDSTSWKKVIHGTGMGSNDIYSIGVQFSFSRDTTALSGDKNFLALEIFEAPVTGAGRLAVQFKRRAWDNEKYKLNFWENTGSSSTGGDSGEFDEDALGFDSAADTESDDLWLQLTLTRGEDAASWSAVCILSNLTDGVEVKRHSPSTFDTSAAYFNNPLYGVINQADQQSNTHLYNRIISRFETSAGDAPGGVVWAVRDSGGTVTEVVGPRIDDGDWHHVAGVFDGGDVELYVDGEKVAAGDAGGSLLGSGNAVNGVIGENFVGTLDDLRIYNSRALTLTYARGIYLEEDHKNPMPQGQLWRIRVDAAGDIAEAVRLHAPLADFHSVEVNPLDPSSGWVIRKSNPFGYPYGGRELHRFSNFGETLTLSTAVRNEKYQTFDEILVNPGDTNQVFLACGGPMRYGLRCSIDGGTTWLDTDRKVGDHLPSIDSWTPMDYQTYGAGLESDINAVFSGSPFAFVPGSPNKLLWICATHGGVFESSDYGATWETAATGGPIKDLGQFNVAHGDPDRWSIGLYEHGFSVTTNNGLSWTAQTHHNDDLLASLANQAQANGSWWTAARVGCGVAFHPVDADIMVAAWSQKGYLLRSTDAGLSWTDTGFRNPMDLWVDVFWSRTDPNRVYAGRMKSDDAGVTWSDIGKVVISVCDSDSDLLVGVNSWQTDVTAASLNMHVSTDGGDSWTSLPDPPRETVPGTSKQWLVTASGRKWNCMADALVAIDPASENLRILLAGRSGIYEYNQASNDWTLRNIGLESSTHYNLIEPVPWMGFVVFDPRPGSGHIVYAAKQNDDRTLGDWAGEENLNHAYPGGENFEPFYRSLDGGITWEKLHSCPDAPSAAMIESMTVDMRGRMFAATTEGIYIFSDEDAGLGGDTIEFVADEGYVNGDLVGQLSWAGDAGSFMVDTNLPGSVSVGSSAWKKVNHSPALAGASGSSYTLGTEFRFSETAASSGSQNMFRLEFGGFGNEAASLSFKRLNSGKYELGFFENSGSSSFFNGTDLLPEDIGTTNGAGAASDPLYLELSLTKGATENNWMAKAVLYNLTDDPGRLSAPLESFTVDFVSSTDFYESLLRPTLNSAAALAANISDVVVESVYFESGATAFMSWIAGYGLSGADAGYTADPDFDLLDNLTEYALGGIPTNAGDEGILPILGETYVYRRRLDPEVAGLEYWVETSSNLVSGIWTTNGIVEIDTGWIDAEFEAVTNEVGAADSDQKFIRLRIFGE